MDWKGWEGKQVFVRTNKDKFYSGNVREVADVGNGIIFVSIIDKFGNFVSFPISQIAEIKEEKESETERPD